MLDISYNFQKIDDITLIIKFIKFFPSLTKLDFSNNTMQNEKFKEFLEILS